MLEAIKRVKWFFTRKQLVGRRAISFVESGHCGFADFELGFKLLKMEMRMKPEAVKAGYKAVRVLQVGEATAVAFGEGANRNHKIDAVVDIYYIK